VKPTFPQFGRHPRFPAVMDAARRAEIARQIEADPESFVAQEQVSLSTVPVKMENGLTPRHVVLRVFAAWTGDGYAILPGGLTRVSNEATSLVVTMQMGGGSKDTWVLGGADEAPVTRPAPISTDSPRQQADLPSRAADNLFWLGRYTERAENTVRLIRALLPGLSGEEDFGHSASLELGIQLLTALGYIGDEFPKGSIGVRRWHLRRLLSNLVYDPARTSTLGLNLQQVRRVTWPLKERLSQDTWRVLQQLEADFSRQAPADSESRVVAQMNLLDRAIVTFSAFSGLLMENTTRGYGWRFLGAGKRLERAFQTCYLLGAALVHAPFQIDPYLHTLLQIADSSITYHSRYFAVMRTEFVLALLLGDEGNPRSLVFQLAALADHLRNLPGDRLDGGPHPLAIAEKSLQFVRNNSADDLAARDAEGNMLELEDLLERVKADLRDISDLLTARYFSHVTASVLTPSI
jgi:uncharacterized alpha-E superfamily protein